MNQSVINGLVDTGNVGVGAAVTGVSAGLINRLFVTQRAFEDSIPLIGGSPVWVYVAVLAGVQGAIFEVLPQVVQNKVASILLQAPMIAAPVVTGLNMYVLEVIIALSIGGLEGVNFWNYKPFVTGVLAELIGSFVKQYLRKSETVLFGGVHNAMKSNEHVDLSSNDQLLMAMHSAGGFNLSE